MDYVTNYTEERINEAKELINKRKRPYIGRMYDEISIIVDFSSYTNIKFIRIAFNPLDEYCNIFVNTNDDNTNLLCKLEVDKLEEFEKIIDGSMKVNIVRTVRHATFFANIFFIEYDENNSMVEVNTPIELRKFLELYDVFYSYEKEYSEFMVVLNQCEYIIHCINPQSKIPSIKDDILFGEFGHNESQYGMYNALVMCHKDLYDLYNKLPVGYKPIRCKTEKDVENLIKEFSKAIRKVYDDTIYYYKYIVTEIDKFMADKLNLLYI